MTILGSFLVAVRSWMSVALALITICGLFAFIAARNNPDDLQQRQLLDSTVWVTTASRGMVHPIDATLGRAGPLLDVPGGPDPSLTTAQYGSDGFVVSQEEGWIRYIDSASRTFGPASELESEGPISLFVAEDVGWVYTGAPAHSLQRIVPGTELQRLGDAIPIVADGDDAVVDRTGAILMPDEETGQVARIASEGEVTRATVAEPGSDLVVRLMREIPMVLNRNNRSLAVLDGKLDIVRECPLEITGTPTAMRGEGDNDRFGVLSGEQASVVVVDTTSCRARTNPVGDPGDEFGPPLHVDGALYVPNHSQRNVWILEIGGDLDRIETVTTRTVVESEAAFELIAENGLVVFNDPQSEAAGIIGRDGKIRGPGKFTIGQQGEPATIDVTEDTIEIEGATVSCSIERGVVAVGDSVSVSAAMASGHRAERYEFEITGQDRITSQDGRLALDFDRTGTFNVSARAALQGGGSSNRVDCGDVVVVEAGDPRLGAADFGCTSTVGIEAMAGQSITFMANLPDTVDSWEWTFSDGSNSPDQEPEHSFADIGPQTATISANLKSGGTLTSTCEFTITEGAPALQPSFRVEPAPPLAGQPARLVSTTLNEEATRSYRWTVEGANLSTADGPVVERVVFDEPGAYPVTLTVENGDGEPFQVTESVVVVPDDGEQGDPPDVAINAIGNRSTNQSVSLSFQTLAGQPITARWEVLLTNDVLVREPQATYDGAAVSHFIPEHRGGTYTIRLTVTDAYDRTDTDEVTFLATLPLNVTALASPTLAAVGQRITFTADTSSSRSPAFRWEFGDGNTASGATVTHTYTTTGSRTVTVTGTLDGVSSRDTVTIRVANRDDIAWVPRLVGDSDSMARRSLSDAKLQVGAVDAVCAVGFPADQVLSQSIPANEQVPVDSSVSYRISDGSDWTVPDVKIGETAADYGLAGKLTVIHQERYTPNPSENGIKTGQSFAAGSQVCGARAVKVYEGFHDPTIVPPEMRCSATALLYGQTATCSVVGGDATVRIDWDDGTSPTVVGAGGSANHVYRTAGVLSPAVIYGGVAYPGPTVTVDPDISVSCANGSIRSVYRLTGASSYAVDANGNPIITASRPVTSSCSVASQAMSDLGGSISWRLVADYHNGADNGNYADGDVPASFEGVQPAVVTFTVTVNGRPRSDQKNVYFSGCG